MGAGHRVSARSVVFADIASVGFPVHARVKIRSVANVQATANECHPSQMDLTARQFLGLLSLWGRQRDLRASLPASITRPGRS